MFSLTALRRLAAGLLVAACCAICTRGTAGQYTNFTNGGGGQFRSFCYTDPEDRAFIKRAVECAAKHFDEVI